jgi:hypothetical protein
MASVHISGGISLEGQAQNIAFGFAGGASSTQVRRRPDPVGHRFANGWRTVKMDTANLNVNTSSSLLHDDAEPNCRRYGRLYTWERRSEADRPRRWMAVADRRQWRQMKNTMVELKIRRTVTRRTAP